jgi:hypothetical protein
MKKRTWTLNVAAAALPLICMVAVSTADARPPRSASSTVTRTGPAGNTATRQSSISTNGQGGYSSSSSYTGRAGNTTTRQQSGSYNPSTKTYTRSGTTTGPAGNRSSFNTSVQATGNGYQRSATRTGPNGKSATESRTIQTGTTPPGN